jgi:peptidoglycan/xylan/chitin deacetylase (PgdA/CDA1 family)
MTHPMRTMTPATAAFPRTTVVLTFLMENWSEGVAPPYSPMTSPPKPGVPDRAGIEWSNYGGRSGIARLLRIAQRHGVSGTICANARSAELFPETVKTVMDAGFELAGHNYAQDQVLSGMDEKDERALIKKCLNILQEISGVRPVGWVSSTLASNEKTVDILAGEGLLWHGDYNYLDQPQKVSARAGAGSIVAIPHSDYADNRVLRGAPDAWYTCHRDMFDYLYRQEEGGLINITMHGNFGGRPLMSAQLDKLLTHILAHDDVWMPRHDELAHWVNRHGIVDKPFTERFPRRPAGNAA